MGFPNPEAVVSIRMKHKLACHQMPCTFETYWESPNPDLMGSAARMLALVEEVNTQVSAKWRVLASGNNTWMATEGYFYCGANQYDVISTAAPEAGDAGGTVLDALPTDVALIIQRRTGLAGRRNRGRMFLPGIWEGFSGGGSLTVAGGVAADDFCAVVGANITAGVDTIGARHWRRDVYTSAQPPVLVTAGDLIPIVDCRWVDVLGTRRDRAPYRFSHAH